MQEYDHIAMVCQGGGSLGAYHIGAYQAMHEKGYEPGIFAGISIGAFTAAILAGNPPAERLSKLKRFWEMISWPDFQPMVRQWPGVQQTYEAMTALWQPYRTVPNFDQLLNQVSSLQGTLLGQPNFFEPLRPGTQGATSFYDTSPVIKTLEELVDFDRINRGESRLILGATDVEAGELVFFDSQEVTITPDHVRASGALPPGFPGVEIDGKLYWDGGCVSNTPLTGLYERVTSGHTLAFMVDLYNPVGPAPQNVNEVITRQTDITYASRGTYDVDQVINTQRRAAALRLMLDQADTDTQRRVETEPGGSMEDMEALAASNNFDVVHIIYDSAPYEVVSSSMEFSRTSIERRAQHGYAEMTHAIETTAFLQEEPAPAMAGATNGQAKSSALEAGSTPKVRMPHMNRVHRQERRAGS